MRFLSAFPQRIGGKDNAVINGQRQLKHHGNGFCVKEIISEYVVGPMFSRADTPNTVRKTGTSIKDCEVNSRTAMITNSAYIRIIFISFSMFRLLLSTVAE